MKPLLFLVLLSSLLYNPGSASALERVFDFEEDAENLPPKGMVVETAPNGRAVVTVQRDPAASTKSQFLAMCGSPFPGVNSLLCLAWFSNMKDGSISVSLKHSGEKEMARTAGLVWRYQSTDNIYSLEWDTRKSTLTLVATIQGKRKILKKEEAFLPPDKWTMLGVNFHDSEIRCEVDGKPFFSAKDSSLMEPGKVGLMLQSDETIFFDNFRIQGND